MRYLGFNKPAFLGDDGMFVVTDASAQYQRPAHLDDALTASATVTSVGGATLIF